MRLFSKHRYRLAILSALAALTVLAVTAGSSQALPCRPDTGARCEGPVPRPKPAPKPRPLPKPLPRPQPSLSAVRHLEVKLVDVTARNTEDITPLWPWKPIDEFYLLGSVLGGSQPTPLATSPILIAQGETKGLDQTIFSGDLPGTSNLDVSLDAFDQDAGKVFEHLPEVMTAIGTVCNTAQSLGINPYGAATYCAASIPLLMPVAKLLQAYNDTDDVLGTYGEHFTVADLGIGKRTYEATYKGSPLGFYSDWDYSVRYEVSTTLK